MSDYALLTDLLTGGFKRTTVQSIAHWIRQFATILVMNSDTFYIITVQTFLFYLVLRSNQRFPLTIVPPQILEANIGESTDCPFNFCKTAIKVCVSK